MELAILVQNYQYFSILFVSIKIKYYFCIAKWTLQSD